MYVNARVGTSATSPRFHSGGTSSLTPECAASAFGSSARAIE